MISSVNSVDSAIAYFHTSAFIPLIVEEPGTARCQQLWLAARHVVSTRLLVVETATALAQALRLGRLTAEQHAAAEDQADRLLSGVNFIEIDGRLVRTAADLSRQFPLRGFDAVHVAGGVLIGGSTMVSGDQRVVDACRRLGYGNG